MVPDHRFNQLKPKSGARVGTGFACGTLEFRCKDSIPDPDPQPASRGAVGLR
jgi:hypothetical protein